MESLEVQAIKFKEMFFLMDKWVKNLHENKEIIQYFNKHGYKNIALYGTSFVSKRMQEELENTDISIEFIFDKNSKEILEENIEKIDAIIVTSLYYYYEIYMDLRNITNLPIISADVVINFA